MEHPTCLSMFGTFENDPFDRTKTWIYLRKCLKTLTVNLSVSVMLVTICFNNLSYWFSFLVTCRECSWSISSVYSRWFTFTYRAMSRCHLNVFPRVCVRSSISFFRRPSSTVCHFSGKDLDAMDCRQLCKGATSVSTKLPCTSRFLSVTTAFVRRLCNHQPTISLLQKGNYHSVEAKTLVRACLYWIGSWYMVLSAR